MNRYFADRFEEIRDARPSASGATLRDLKDELEQLVGEIDERLAERRDRVARADTGGPALDSASARARA